MQGFGDACTSSVTSESNSRVVACDKNHIQTESANSGIVTGNVRTYSTNKTKVIFTAQEQHNTVFYCVLCPGGL